MNAPNVRRVELFKGRVNMALGYEMIDNRTAGGNKTEGSTATCQHCNRAILLRKDPKYPRGRCRYCHAFICHDCVLALHLTQICTSVDQGIELVRCGEDVQPFNVTRSEIELAARRKSKVY